MKKIFLAIMFALIGMSASFAQELEITHNATVEGIRCMQFTCKFAVNYNGAVNIAVLVMDGNGELLESRNNNYDVDGTFGTMLENARVSANRDLEANLYIPNDVISQHCEKGYTYYSYFVMLDDDGEVILESEPIDFYLK